MIEFLVSSIKLYSFVIEINVIHHIPMIFCFISLAENPKMLVRVLYFSFVSTCCELSKFVCETGVRLNL